MGANRTRAFSVKEKYLMLCRIWSQCPYCFHHRGCWEWRTRSPYFTSLLAILQYSKRQRLCLLQMSNTHTPYSRFSMVMSYMEELLVHYTTDSIFCLLTFHVQKKLDLSNQYNVMSPVIMPLPSFFIVKHYCQ